MVEIKDIQLPDNMQRAMAREAEAERERRAKIVAAEGEYQAAVKLGEAADIIAQHPVALQLRTLQTMAEIVDREELDHHLPDAVHDHRPGGPGTAGEGLGDQIVSAYAATDATARSGT